MEDGEIEEGMLMEEDTFVNHQFHPVTMKSPSESLKESKAAVEDTVAQMLSIKNENQPKSLLRELVTQMFLHFVNLRQVNRCILLEEDRVKAETERAKAPVDFTTLQLHNLMYEKSHYVKAIKACKDFKSKYPDIELVPEEEFLRDAPEHIKGPEPVKDSSHNLMLKRLNYELHQRKELCKRREKLEQCKKALLETIANRKKFLSSLPSHLKSLKKASLPVQNQLGVLHAKKIKQHQSAELLPPPLYVVYSQFLAQKEAFGENIDLEITGSLKDAQAFARQRANKDTGMSTNIENSRLEEDAVDEEDDGQRRRKRPKKVPSKDTVDAAGGYQVHPLKVILHINDDEVSDPKLAKLIILKFEYLVKLNVVCAGIEGPSEVSEGNILCNLFPDDTGHELPHQSAKLRFWDSMVFDGKRSSFPYKWAQHLAGIDFLPEVSPLLIDSESQDSEAPKKCDSVISGLSLYRQQNRIPTVLQRIRSRKKAQMALLGQLASLAKLKWPSLNYENAPWAVHSPTCDLCGWSPTGPVTCNTEALQVLEVQEPIDVDMDGKSLAGKDELEGAREDGELPLLSVVRNDEKFTPSKGSNSDRLRQLSLISKVSPVSKLKSLSFRKTDELDILLDADSEGDELVFVEPEAENKASVEGYETAERSWVDYEVKEYVLVLSKKVIGDERTFKLEAKVKISMEYPLRPPLFAVDFHVTGEKSNHSDGSEYNELRAMETAVNVHIMKRLPKEEEKYILAHQVRCLAMLFDSYLDKESQTSGNTNSTSIMDIGLCEPINGSLVSRSFRGRDRRKMISCKGVQSTACSLDD